MSSQSDDVLLNAYILIVMREKDKPIFNALEEPYFWGHFLKPWIQFGISDRDKIEKNTLKING